MVNPNSKLHATQNPPYVFFITLTIFLAQISNVKSESFSFNFPSIETGALSILVDGDANTTDGALQLTKKDQYGNPTEHSVGLSAFYGVLHLSDKKTGKVADFATEFSFVVNKKGEPFHGDGFTFYLASQDFEFPDDSSGGYLGLFNKETAFNTSSNQVVAVEFDSFANSWDPNSAHIGVDINSLKSVTTAPWPLDSHPQGSIGRARIIYESSFKLLSVSVDYPNSPVKLNATLLSYEFDIGAVLSEYVLFGFTGATGDLVETHDILSWSFNSDL